MVDNSFTWLPSWPCFWETASWALSEENCCSPLVGSSRRRMSEECKCSWLYASRQLIPSYAVPASISLFLQSPRAEAPELLGCLCRSGCPEGQAFHIGASEKCVTSWLLVFCANQLEKSFFCLIQETRSLSHCSKKSCIFSVMLLNTFWGLLLLPSLWICHVMHSHKQESEEADAPPRWALNFEGGLWDHIFWQRGL